jgi:hypothetical protein
MRPNFLVRWMMSLDKLSCKKATLLAAKRDYVQISKKERFQLWYHYRLCYVCKIWENQSRLLDKIIQERIMSSLKSERLTDKDKERIKTELKNIS